MKIDPNAPAFPVPGITCGRSGNGLTIRAEIASRCLAGMLSDSTLIGSYEDYAADAIAFTNALIAQLNEEE